jgi:1-acyl-sn-glycerol-3-phosphate acyltransferase
MQANRIKTFLMLMMLGLYTGYIAAKTVFKATFSHISRAWVDQLTQDWSHRLLHIIGVNPKIVNPHQVTPTPHRATLVVCNHTSLFDIPISFLAFPNHSLRMLAKKELTRIPFFGRGMQVSEFPSIDRKNRQQAIKDLKKLRALMEDGVLMWVAPEGTRSKTGRLGSFKKGAFITAIEAQAMIIPIGIRGAHDILPAKSLRLKLNQPTEIHIGEPIDAQGYTLDQKEQLIATVRASMLKLVGEA